MSNIGSDHVIFFWYVKIIESTIDLELLRRKLVIPGLCVCKLDGSCEKKNSRTSKVNPGKTVMELKCDFAILDQDMYFFNA